ncbi:Hypothetical predicted protein [Pelobates cultripes]|uniref:Uncharacterized protein n=1 Tax=Pelobates cultripes TaxID=61616 RepID=A0AAD1SIB7_PELCU|nr:Hypothetical predicted protein [Pelobates cultripes]
MIFCLWVTDELLAMTITRSLNFSARNPIKDPQEQIIDSKTHPSNTSNIIQEVALNQFPSEAQAIASISIQDQFKQTLELQLNLLKQEMLVSFNEIKQEIKNVAVSVVEVERKCEVFGTQIKAINTEVQFLVNKVDNLENKIAALEDRSRKRNIRVRGVSEEISNEKLREYLNNLFEEVLPEIPTDEYKIENFHRIHKPDTTASHLPRDVIVSFSSLSLRNNLMKACRTKPRTNSIYKDIIFLQDLSYHTRTWRKSFSIVTDFLRKAEIRFQWAYPTSLRFTWKQERKIFWDANEANSWLSGINKKA